MSSPVGYPLSVQQGRLVDADGARRSIAVTLALPGVPAEEVPARLDRAVAGHEVYRSTLQSSAALTRPVQAVHEQATTEWRAVADTSALEAAATELRGRLDPEQGPVLVGAVAPSPEGATLWLAASAAFCDLATLEALAGEVAGTVAPADDPIQYAEYAAWQDDLVSDEASEDTGSALATWARLSDDEATTRLPDEGADPATGAGAESDLARPVTARPAGDDPAAWWLAAWALVTARFTGEDAVTLGVEVDPRANPDLAGAAGPYARLVPLTFEVPTAGSFSAFVADVAQALAQARTWIEWAPETTAPVLFSVGSVSASVERAPHQLELRVTPDGSAAVVTPGGSGSAGLAARVRAGLAQLVEGAGSDAIEGLEVLDPGAVAAQLGPAPEPVTAQPVVARLLAHAESTPDRVALTDGKEALTYAELARRVEALASAVAATGATGPVAVHLPRSVDAVVAMLAAQRAGVGYVPLDVDGPADRAVLQAGLAGSTVLVGTAPAGFTGSVLSLDADGASAAALPEPDGAHLAYVLFTSGSTGVPKGVAVGQDNLAGYADAVLHVVEQAAGRAGAELTWGQITGLTTDLGNTSIYGALASGGTLHLVPTELVQDPAALSAHLATSPLDVLKITPTHLRALLADPEAEVLPAAVLVLGGEALTWELVDTVRQRGGCRVLNHYGPTETTVGALTFPADAEPRPATPTVPVGRPLAGYEALVVDRRLRLVPPGAVGELLVAGAGVARGYVGNDEATSASFVEHPYRPGVPAYRTGDLVTRGADGAITFLGRRDDQVKVRGYRVEPHEVELVLTQHPDVRRAAVVLRRDLGPEPVLVGYVVTQVNPSPSEADLRAHVGQSLPEHMVPSRFVDLDTLPLRANGKLDVQALPAPARVSTGASEPPSGPTEEALAAIFAEALGVPEVRATDDFFALGGHSLLATRVVVEIRSRLGAQLPVYTLFDAPTVRQLAAEVDAATGGPSEDELSALIAEISTLSDEEAALLLAEESPTSSDDRPESGR